MCSFATKFVVESWSTIAEADTKFAPNPTIAAVDKEPLTSSAICAELDNNVLPNSDSAVVTLVEKLALAGVNEPLISADI